MKISFRRFIYNVFFRLSPLFILVFLELLLRFIGIGESYRIFERSADKQKYELNANFYKRFMAAEQFDTLAFPHQEFSVHKAPETRRIFLIADHSLFSLYPGAAESPFLSSVTGADNSIRYEIIQLAVPLTNSFAVRRMAMDIRRYSPDACIILSGANEFYGLPRKSSWIRDSDNYYGISAYVFLKNNRFFQLLERFVYLKNPRSEQFPPKNIDEWGVPRESGPYTESRALFRRNLESIVRNAEVPVFLVTLPVNIKAAPYRSDFSDKELSDNEIIRECAILVNNADRFTLERWIDELKAWEPESAAYFYCRAMIDEREGEYIQALEHYKHAVAEDMFRVRSEPDINEDIRNISSEDKVILIDAEAGFLRNSQNGLAVRRYFKDGRKLNAGGETLLKNIILDSLRSYFEN